MTNQVDYYHLIVAVIFFIAAVATAITEHSVISFIVSVGCWFFFFQELRKAIPKPKQ